MDGLWRIVDHLYQGGWVMLPLLGVSLLMWGLIVDRFVVLWRLGHRDLALGEAARALDDGAVPAGRGLRRQLVRELHEARVGVPAGDRALLHVAADGLRRHTESGLRLIEVLVAVAPLLGLLGTVLGMIETFGVISVFGTGNPRALAGGISVAMITTQTGLLVAIPGLFAVGRLRRAARSHGLRLDEAVVVLDRTLTRETAP